jgi:uncharacterized surface protein with fasciclin (FAS1) repeats
MDYHILSNRNYDYVELMQAKARGLSDSQIATISKIARESGMPFGYVARRVEAGATFPMLATQYNLKLADVYSNEKEKARIADYISTYESIGTKSGSSGGMMDMSMDKTMPMAVDTVTTSTTTSSTTTTTPTPPAPMATPTGTMDIVDTAMAAKNLTTLVKAIQTAGLVETLKGAGPFTVFAPDDKAFSRLPSGTLDSLLADPAKLKQVLEYHVIPASIDAATAMSMTSPTSPPTVEGSTLQVTKGRRGRLKVNNATVTKANIGASNGIIHVIDRVLLPPMDASGNIIPAGSTSGTGTGTTGTDTTGTTGTGATGTGTTGTGTTGTGTTTPAAPAAPAAPTQ